jgi:hypothetical protein
MIVLTQSQAEIFELKAKINLGILLRFEEQTKQMFQAIYYTSTSHKYNAFCEWLINHFNTNPIFTSFKWNENVAIILTPGTLGVLFSQFENNYIST